MDHKLARPLTDLVMRQHGVVSVAQLLMLGWSHTMIAGRVRAGWLHRVHHGVYAVNQRRLTARGRWMAAVLALGSGAVLSHRDAGALHDLCSAGVGPIHVTVSGPGGRARRDGITVHRSTTLTSQRWALSTASRSQGLHAP